MLVFGVALALGLIATSSSRADACCGSGGGAAGAQAKPAGHDGHGAAAQPVATTAKAAATIAAAKEPPASMTAVLDQYAKIQAALAGDTIEGVPAAARAIGKLAADDAGKTLPADVATQADALGKAKDLDAARAAFKPLSSALSRYLTAEKIKTGRYVQAYCPMAKAGWLQTDKAIKNPYYGKSMLSCGEIVTTF
ncbi:MAG: DUF3347 domain-containing protein [Lentisphaerae bacterium]|nr:DUF3347 domain-containing protein [Lentisphaerota bacterium]